MSTSVQTRTPDPSVQLRSQLASMSDQFKAALPSHIKPEKFQRVVMTVVQQNPELMSLDRRSLLGSCLKCAADGLVPDGREAALVKFGTAVQYMPMLAGIQKRVRNSGEIAGIEAHVIYEHDTFVWVQGIENRIEHTPLFPGDRGKAIGAYAIARFKDGSLPQFEVMDLAEIDRVRNVSRSKNNGPWVQWWSEMARKTVFRRLSKWLPMDAEVDTILSRDDEQPTTIDVAPSAPNVVAIEHSRGASKLDTLDGVADEIAPASNASSLVEQIDACVDYHAYQALEPACKAAAVEAEQRGDDEAAERINAAMQAAILRFQGSPVGGGKSR